MLTVGSLFSGIEGFGLGFERAGARVVWHVEKDRDCQTVIARHFEGRTFGDVRAVGAHNLTAVDLICGGFPCQDLSVAGRRAGLAGERSGLWYEFHRILTELRPRWVVIENVPGLLSSNDGRDMAVVLGGLGELGYGWAYRVLDAQYFGVAQRRRRVFVVGCLGDTASAVQVLFESESCDGDSPPSRQAREGVAGTLVGGASGGSSHGKHSGSDRMTFVPETYALRSDASRSGEASNPSRDASGRLRKRDAGFNVETERVPTLDATAAHYVAQTLTSGGHPNSNAPGRHHEDDVNLIAHTLSSEGSDASEDGTGRGTPLIAIPIQDGRDLAQKGQNGLGIGRQGDPAYTVDTTGGGAAAYPLAMRGRADGAELEMGAEGVYNALRAGDGASSRANHLLSGMAVRRLTPIECERLQGFPDGWTARLSDSARYRMLGNAVCVPVAEWIGRQLLAVLDRTREATA